MDPDEADSAERPRDFGIGFIGDRSASSAPALRLRAVTKRHGARTVLRSIDLDVAAGETVAVLGPNGSGKSTLLRIAAGLGRPDAGTVAIAGHDPRSEPLAARKACSALAQEAPLYDELTPREHVVWWARLHGRPAAEAEAGADAQLVGAGLTRLAHHPVRTLSRGERQRLALTLAFLPDAPLVVLDEPFAALDAVAHQWLESRLAERRAGGGATLLSLHDEEAAARVADRVLRLGQTTGSQMSPMTQMAGTGAASVPSASSATNGRGGPGP